jgi:hypothetical protein
MPGGEQLSRKRELALSALLVEPTIVGAAQKVGVTEKTLRNWLSQPDFAAEFKARCKGVLDSATSLLSGATESAVECLRRNLECGKAAAEIRAAIGILDHALKTVELLDLMKRLDALEEAIKRGQTLPLNRRIVDTNGDNGLASEHQGTP